MLMSSGISTPMAIEKRKTPFSITRKPTMCEKMRERRTIRIRPLSRAYNATPKKTRSMAESAM